MKEDLELRRLLWYVLGATRGGENRARIVSALKERPANINQLSTRLSMDYRLVTHHVGFLGKNSLLHASGDRYGRMYFLNPWLESNYEMFEEIVRRLKFEVG